MIDIHIGPFWISPPLPGWRWWWEVRYRGHDLRNKAGSLIKWSNETKAREAVEKLKELLDEG